MAYDATLRNLELIGEAATQFPAEIREANPEIPWRLIVATRNRLVLARRTHINLINGSEHWRHPARLA